jgi:hypothetical protein
VGTLDEPDVLALLDLLNQRLKLIKRPSKT